MSPSAGFWQRFARASVVDGGRATTLCAVGALTGLGIAGYGLFTAAGTSTRHLPPEDVATVNQRPILRSDFATQLEMETGHRLSGSSRQEQLKVLDEMVREELLVQRALELDFGETDQNARNALAAAVSDEILAEVTTAQTTDDELRRYFHDHPGKWATEGTMHLRDLVVGGAAETGGSRDATARRAADALRAGQSVETVAARFGLAEVGPREEEYDFAVKFRLGDAAFAALAELAAGEVAAPLPAKDGIHVVQMVANSRPVPLSFEAARAQVLTDFEDAERERVLGNTLKFLRGRAKLRVADDYAAEYAP